MILILLITLITTLVYWKLRKHYTYWTECGVKQRKQVYLFGDVFDNFLRRESIFESVINWYKAFSDERYMGIYQMVRPILIIRDPELIKQITVKDFDHFQNHLSFIPEGIDPLWNRNLFALKDEEWRNMRTTLSPSFTSSKMKMMFSLISECADEFTNYFLENDNSQVLEMKDILTRYTNDVIASIAFGIKCDSLKERDNSFFTMGGKITKFGANANLKFLMYLLAPKLSKLLGIKLFPSDATTFLFDVIMETVRLREAEGIIRPDMLNLLIEARKGKKTPLIESNNVVDTGFASVEESTIITETKSSKGEITDLDIAAQAFVFLFGGFESVSTLMSFAIYELTLNQEIQKKLQQEIDDTLKECNEKLTYDALMKMKYMDMVISETLRKWPPTILTDRLCTKPYTINPIRNNEKPIYLKPGDSIWFPIYAIHYDEKYFPSSKEFKPERFADENKDNIKPYTFIPFGNGPRNCIGSRFALMETKAILFYILSKFDVLVCQKTDIPIQLCNKSMQVKTKNGVWVEIKPRNRL